MSNDQNNEIINITKNQESLVLMTPKQTAAYLNISNMTLWRYRKNIPNFPRPVYSGKHRLSFVQSEIKKWKGSKETQEYFKK